jgi:hypothetical protein
MANKQIIEYIHEAQGSQLTKAEILNNLKEAGWTDIEVRDAFAYINLYDDQPKVSKNYSVAAPPIVVNFRWVSLVCFCLGYVWLISGTNKILSTRFISGFADVVRGQISDGAAPQFYKSFLSSFVLPNASFVSHMIQYSEFAIGFVLAVGGLYSFFSSKKWLNFFLCLASIGSVLMISNIILSFGMPLPWINVENVFAQGVNIEYLMLSLSLVLAGSYFWDL